MSGKRLVVFAVWLLAVFYCQAGTFYYFSFLHADGTRPSPLLFWIRLGAAAYYLLLPLGLWLFHTDRRFLLAFSLLCSIQTAASGLLFAAVFSPAVHGFVLIILSVFSVFLLPYGVFPFSLSRVFVTVITGYMLLLAVFGWVLLRRKPV